MARWSVTNDANGAPNRFWVWADGTDKFQHSELQKNWDTLDAIIGGPSTWPNTRGSGGGIWKEMSNLSADLVPLGSVIAWYRPSSSVSLPSGWVPCDGRTVLAANHSYGGGNISVPDLRNRFILGALSPDGGDVTVPGGVYSYSGDGNAGIGNDSNTSAPGINGFGGSNAANLHTHTIPNHYHIFNHIHEFNSTAPSDTQPNDFVANVTGGGAGAADLSKKNHNHQVDDMTAKAVGPSSTIGTSTTRTHTTLPVIEGSGPSAIDASSLANPQGGANVASANAEALTAATLMTTNGASYDPRPRYTGLLYIVKVKRIATT